MAHRKYSLYLTLGLIIIATVTVIMSINSAYSYINTKNKIINDMKESSRTTIISLENNVENLIASYAVNEYDNLVLNEIKRRDIFAIVVHDYNMGKITGKKAYISGKIRDSQSNIIDYDVTNAEQNEQLKNCFYSDTFNIVSASQKKLGTISIYISDETMNKELGKIIEDTLKNTVAISLLLILSLFLTIRFYILKPISDIIDVISDSDKDGIPISIIPDNKTKEISTLSNTMNNMIKSIKASRLILKENENKLFQALELQTRIFDDSGYVIIRTDKDGLIKQINKEAERLLGYSSEELIDIYTPELIHLESEGMRRAEDFSKELNQEVKPGFDVFIAKSNLGLTNEHEWTYITKEGKHIPVLLSVTALKDKDNEIYGYLGIAKDVTQRKLMESQAKLASMGEMIGNIAHQWRQPLSVISTIASGVKVRSEFNQLDISTIAEDMNHITKQTQYLSNTIDDFRNFIKETNKKEKISILHIAEKALSIAHSSIVSSNINVVSNLRDDIIIDGFQNQLIQSIINIINNAKDAMSEYEKDEDKLIFIETEHTNTGLTLRIKDSGGGIKEDILNKIFEPYFTTKHKNVGTGIGLSMVYQIVTEYHNATIEVSNETYQYNGKQYTGACFQINFRP